MASARRAFLLGALLVALAPAAPAAETAAAIEARISAALDPVPAIDNHTHLLVPGTTFNPSYETLVPVMLRSTRPETVAVLKSRFGVEWDPRQGVALEAEARKVRAGMIARAGSEAKYWEEHLAFIGTQIALVNQERSTGTNGRTLLWVPYGTTLATPFPNDALSARHPGVAAQVRNAVERNRELWREMGIEEAPVTLNGYLPLVDRVLARYKEQGAVALKFTDAYLRTLHIADVPRTRAEAMYGKARSRSATRDDYLALQDYLYRHMFKRCGELGLPVHIHSSHGAGPFLRLQDSDVRNLEDVVSDPTLFGTQFVLIHGGAPWHEAAAYMAAAKAHVWIDLSAMPFLYPVPELAVVVRKYLSFAPERTLFGTDPMSAPMVPVGPEVAHIVLSRALRQALYKALAAMVAEGMFDEARALEMGRGVLRDNARRLYRLD